MKKTNKTRTPQEQYARDVKLEKVKIGALCHGGILLFAVLLALFASSLAEGIRKNQPEQAAEVEVFGAAAEPAEGVGREVVSETYTPAAATISADVLDYTSGVIWGWDGRYCELWEMDLYARIMYLEFWGTSAVCCEAGADSILRMLESGYFGDSLGEVLSARSESGALVYSTYAYVWDWVYDPDGLAEMYALCVDRWTNGPVWVAPFFQLYYYPAWAVPSYQIDGVFFSVARWW